MQKKTKLSSQNHRMDGGTLSVTRQCLFHCLVFSLLFSKIFLHLKMFMHEMIQWLIHYICFALKNKRGKKIAPDDECEL